MSGRSSFLSGKLVRLRRNQSAFSSGCRPNARPLLPCSAVVLTPSPDWLRAIRKNPVRHMSWSPDIPITAWRINRSCRSGISGRHHGERGVLGTPPEICHVAVPFGLCKPEGSREEKSQRTRALVYLTLGVATALQAGTDTLWVYENGVGALNLPLDATQLGVDNYRGVHPRSLMMVEDLFCNGVRASSSNQESFPIPHQSRNVQGIIIRRPGRFHTRHRLLRQLPSAHP